MSFIYECPFCKQRMSCDDTMIGMTVQCPTCGQEVVVIREKNGGSRVEMPTFDRGKSNGKSKDGCRNAAGMKSSTDRRSPKKWFLSYSNQDGSFKNPLLSTVLYYAGLVSVVIAAIIAVFQICADIVSGRCTYHPEVYVVAAVFFVDAVFNFGVAQIIYYIGRTAYNSDRIVELLADQKKR